MRERVEHITLAELKDLFYRSRFNEVLKTLGDIEESGEALSTEFALIRANTLFELHQVAESRQQLEHIQETGDANDPQYLYASARLSYFDDQLLEAQKTFKKITELDCSQSLRFKGLLGVANTMCSLKDFEGIPEVLKELLSFEPIEQEDEKLSLLIFLGNYYLHEGENIVLAKDYFRKAMASAAAKSWTYFIVRSLIGLASVCEKDGQSAELSWTLSMLQAFIDSSQQFYLIHLVNKQFKQHFTVNAALEFDTANNRIFVNNRWIAFHEKPLLFRFLLMLHGNEMFVPKKQIATNLWPEEGYKPRIHDPRIFDIAKRARAMIEAYDKQPVVLLSGRMGYKLASI